MMFNTSTNHELTSQESLIQFPLTSSSTTGELTVTSIINNFPYSFIPKNLFQKVNLAISLEPWMETDLSSIRPLKLLIKSDTASFEHILLKNIFMFKMTSLIQEIIEGEIIFKEIDVTTPLKTISGFIDKIPSDQLVSISQDEMEQRIRKVMFVEVMSKILSGFSSDEVDSFEDVIKRRPLFD